MKLSHTISAFLIYLIVGCSSNEPSSQIDFEQDDSRLSNQSILGAWLVQSIQSDEGNITLIPSDAQWKMVFNYDESDSSKLAGVGLGPCGGFSFVYEFSDSTLTRLGGLIQPAAVCAALAQITLPDQEQFVYSIFTDSQTFIVESEYNDSLSILSGRNEKLILEKETPINEGIRDKEWQLSHVRDENGEIVVVTQEADFEFILQFTLEGNSSENAIAQADSEVGGVNVCNVFNGNYTLTGNLLNLISLSGDARDCERSQEPVSEIFRRVLFSVEALPPYVSLKSNVLVVTSRDNEALYFTEMSAGLGVAETTKLLNSRWNLSSYEDSNALANGPAVNESEYFTLRLIPESESVSSRGRVTGTFVCNGYASDYVLRNGYLLFTNTEITSDACAQYTESAGVVSKVLFFEQILAVEVNDDTNIAR